MSFKVQQNANGGHHYKYQDLENQYYYSNNNNNKQVKQPIHGTTIHQGMNKTQQYHPFQGREVLSEITNINPQGLKQQTLNGKVKVTTIQQQVAHTNQGYSSTSSAPIQVNNNTNTYSNNQQQGTYSLFASSRLRPEDLLAPSLECSSSFGNSYEEELNFETRHDEPLNFDDFQCDEEEDEEMSTSNNQMIDEEEVLEEEEIQEEDEVDPCKLQEAAQREPSNLLPCMQPLYYFGDEQSKRNKKRSSQSLQTGTRLYEELNKIIFVTDFNDDVLNNFKLCEWKNRPDPEYMTQVQSDISPNMRCILVDWMNEVSLVYRLLPETLYLAVNITDRALSKIRISRSKLQAVGVTALFIASKYCEISPPELKDFVTIADDSYTKEEVLLIEKHILNAIDFELCVVHSYDFVEHFLMQTGYINDAIVKHLSYYICESQLQNYSTLNYKPSMIAICSIMVALYVLDYPFWTKEISDCCTVQDDSFVVKMNECLKLVFDYYVSLANGTLAYCSIKSKFSHSNFYEVGKVNRKLNQKPPQIGTNK
ncbi:hypothetical protein ABK040_010913 [Willaertia magna]